MTVLACSRSTLTYTMLQTQDMTPHPVTVYRHRANLSLSYSLMWNITLEYTATHFNVLGKTQPGKSSPTSPTHQRKCSTLCCYGGGQLEAKEKIPGFEPLYYPLAHTCFLMKKVSNIGVYGALCKVLLFSYDKYSLKHSSKGKYTGVTV